MKVLLFALVLLVCLATHAAADSCPGISQETTQRVFERVKQVAVGSGYRFDGLGTNKSELIVLWSLNGKDCPPLRVSVENCASPSAPPILQLHVPPELSVRCPGLDVVVQELRNAVPAEHPVGRRLSLPPTGRGKMTAVVVLVLVAGLVIRRFLRPASGRMFGWGDIGWIIFTVTAAIPFFFNLPFAVTMELGVAWVLFAILLYDRALLDGDSRAQKAALLGLFCASLLLHWGMSSGGPGDLHLNLSGIWSWSFGLELRWGPAPIALFRLLDAVFDGIRDTQIIWCNLVLSSLLLVLLYWIVVELGVNQRAALMAAMVTAAHPLLISFSGVMERQPAYLFAASGSILSLIGFLKRGQARRLIAFVLGTLLATMCRPEGMHVLAVHLAVLLLVASTRRVRAAAALVLTLMIPLALAYTRYVLGGGGQFHFLLGASWNSLLDPSAFHSRFPLLGTVLFSPDFTPVAWIAIWIAGLLLGIRHRAAWVGLLTLVGLDLAWRWAGLYRMFVGHERQVASARYESILLIPFMLGAALFIQAGLKASPWLRVSLVAVFLVFTAMTFRRPYATLLEPFTVDHEYQFLRKYALTLPPRARLYVLDSPISDIGFLDAHLVGEFVASQVTFALWSERQCEDVLHDPSQTYIYIGSSCAELLDNDPGFPLPSPEYQDWMSDCAAIRARVVGDPVEEIDVPAHKMAWHDFRSSTVHLGIYRLRDPSVCALGEQGRRQLEGH